MPPAKKPTAKKAKPENPTPEVALADPQDVVNAPKSAAEKTEFRDRNGSDVEGDSEFIEEAAKENEEKSLGDLIREVDPNYKDGQPISKYDIVTKKDGTIAFVRTLERDFRV